MSDQPSEIPERADFVADGAAHARLANTVPVTAASPAGPAPAVEGRAGGQPIRPPQLPAQPYNTSPEVSEAMAPTDIAAVMAQTQSLIEAYAQGIRMLARGPYTASAMGYSLGEDDLNACIAQLEHLTDMSIQLRNSLATHR